MAEHINKTDTLNEGRVKLNAAISDSNIAKGKAEQADVKSTQALANSESTQIQLDTIVIEGDSSVEAAQARVDEKGEGHATLKARIDDGFEKTSSQLAQTATRKADKTETGNLQTQINTLVLQAGNPGASSAEIEQSRGPYTVLNDKLEVNQTYTLQSRKDLYGDIKGNLYKGYYTSNNGTYTEGVNWYHYRIYNGMEKSYVLDYPIKITLRLIQFDDTGIFISATFITNGSFQLHETCVSFVVTLTLENGEPLVPSVTSFASVRDFTNVIIKPQTSESVTKKIDNNKKAINDSQKVINDNLLKVPINIDENNTLKTLLDIEMKNGYYANGTGNYINVPGGNGTNWFHYLVDVRIIKKYVLENKINSGSVRVVYLSNGNFISSSYVSTSVDFEIPDNVTHFSLNIPISGATPPTTVTTFPDLVGFELYGYVPEHEEKSLVNLVMSMRESGGIIDPLYGKKVGIAGSSSIADGAGRPESFMKVIENKTGYIPFNNAIGGAELSDPNGAGDVPVLTDNIFTQIKNLPLDLDMVIVQPAVNDERQSNHILGAFEDRDITTVYGALHLMCDYLIKNYTEKAVGVLTGQYSTPQNRVERSLYHEAIEKVCNWYGIPVVNLKEEGQTPYHLPYFKQNYCLDDLHLNAEGNKILSKRVESFMRMLIGK